MKPWAFWEKYLKIKGIYLQNYSYLSSLYPLHSKQDANLLLWHSPISQWYYLPVVLFTYSWKLI